jgi:hypothetical protein
MKNKQKYPKHDYSHYIDQEFSFNNTVYPSKGEVVNELKNMSCDGNIMLEPRLQEYVKKKKYYRDNNITPCISLEQEYLITGTDKRILRSFFKGRRDVHDMQNPKFNDLSREQPLPKTYFPSKKFRDDPKLKAISPRQYDKPKNMGMFVPDSEEEESYYDGPINPSNMPIDQRDIKGFKLDDAKEFNPRLDPKINPGKERYDKYTSQYRTITTNVKRPDEYKHHYGMADPRNSAIISNLESQEKKMSNTFNCGYSPFDEACKASDNNFESANDDRYGELPETQLGGKADMDTELKTVTPSISMKGKHLDTSRYTMMPTYSDTKIRDCELESDMVRGMPSHTRKSYGYRDTAEHSFSYIDADFNIDGSNPELWTRGGQNTRLLNKKLSKQNHVREIV